jgi:hypothetical protein
MLREQTLVPNFAGSYQGEDGAWMLREQTLVPILQDLTRGKRRHGCLGSQHCSLIFQHLLEGRSGIDAKASGLAMSMFHFFVNESILFLAFDHEKMNDSFFSTFIN